MRKWTVIAVLLLAAGLALYLSAPRGSIPFLSSAAVPRPAAPPVPVSAEPPQRHDVPIYLTGLVTVQPYTSVLVNSRVDGHIVNIPFSEGKDVTAVHAFLHIAPRP